MVKVCNGLSAVVGSALLLLAVISAAAQTPSSDVKATYAEIEKAFGFVPSFLRVVPAESLPGAWQAMRDLELNPNTELPGKYKALINVAVAAQIPCAYCLYIDTETAKVEGATEKEIQEALMMAAVTRHWSTVLNGLQIDMDDFRKDLEGILSFATAATGKPAPPSVPVTDAQSAYRDMERTLGRVPNFMRAYPSVSIAGAWKEFKAVQLNPNTAIPGKYKELIGLAVASQIPCTYCVEAHTSFATQAGASPQEIAEAVGMAALVRHWSTLANGSQQDLATFKSEVDRMLKFTMASASRE